MALKKSLKNFIFYYLFLVKQKLTIEVFRHFERARSNLLIYEIALSFLLAMTEICYYIFSGTLIPNKFIALAIACAHNLESCNLNTFTFSSSSFKIGHS